MQLSGVKLIITSSLFVSAWSVAVVDNDSTPGGRIVTTSKTLLKPLLNSQDGMQGKERRESVLRGLLQVRQRVCPSGYGQCPLGVCCQLNGGCCPNNTCCGPNQRCCSVGCCYLSDYCVEDPSTGRRGCCPLGETCSGVSDTCEDEGYLPCSNDDFCCPSGESCFRDSSNRPRCSSSRSNPDPTTRRATTRQTTSTKSTFTTRAASATGVSSATKTSVLDPTIYSTPSISTQSVVVGADDTRIYWVGTSWILGNSSCNSTAQSRKTSENGGFLLNVPPRTTVYLAVSGHNVEYEITVDERSTTYREPSILNDCKLTWSSGILVNDTNIIVTVLGSASSSSDERRQLSNTWSFEFHHFLMAAPDFYTSPTNTGLINPSGFTSNSAIYLKTHSMLYTGLMIAFVSFFSFFC